jgi:NitT/TauT family transport system substrate-binding protein
MLVKTTSVKDRDILRNMVPQGSNPAGAVNEASLRDDYKFYKSQGLIPKDIDPDSIVDNSFAAAAVAKLGPYQRAEQ